MKLLKSGLLASLVFSTASLVSIQSPAKADCTRWHPHHCVEVPTGGYETNKFDLKARVEEGGWTTSWADDISETDAAQGLVAAGISVYTANSGPFIVWVEQLVQRTINSISADLTGNALKEAEQLARQIIYDAVSGKSAKEITKQFDTVDFKAGAIKYSGRNLLGGQTISTTWGLKPYVAFRVRSSSGDVVSTSHSRFVNAGGKCLDVHAPDMRHNGGRVQVWDCNGEPQQQWSLRGNKLVNAGGKCLDVHAPDMRHNGGRVQVWDCNGEPQQQWSLNGNKLVNAGGKCLDVHAPDMRNNGGRVQVWDCNGEPQQQWSF